MLGQFVAGQVPALVGGTSQDLVRLPLAQLLPAERCRFNDRVTTSTGVLQRALVDEPQQQWYRRPLTPAEYREARDKWAAWARKMDQQIAARYPGANPLEVFDAYAAVEDEATRKAARKLDADPLDVAVAARQLWSRSLTDERDAQVGDLAKPRARQARRGHVTRRLVESLRPVVQDLETARGRQPDGQD